MKVLIFNCGYFVKESFISLCKNPLLNLISVLSIGLSLLLLAIIFTGWWASEEVVDYIRQDAEIAVFYDQGLDRGEVSFLEERIEEEEGIDNVRHVDEAEAYERMEKMLGEGAEVLAALDDNPFEPFLAVNVDAGVVTEVAKKLSGFEGVDYIRDNEDLIGQFQAISKTIRYIGLGLILIVGITTMIITSHIIRLGIKSKEDQINTLKLLGADRVFISFPFLLEGVWLGGAGGLMAAILTITLFPRGVDLMYNALPFVPFIPVGEVLLLVSGLVLALGIVFSLLGSLIALRFTGAK